MTSKKLQNSRFTNISCCLPEEVVSYIFRFLSPVDIQSASLVCQSWAKASEDPLLWKHTAVILFTKNENFSEDLLDSLKRRCIQHVSFRHTTTSLQVVQVCKRLSSNLKGLSLEGCRCVSESLLGIILKSCKNLKQVNLSRCRQLDVSKQSKWLVANSLKYITVLDLSCTKGLCDWTIGQIPTTFPGLEKLGISGCKEVSLKTWMILGKSLTCLKNLDISRSDISDETLLKFAELPSLHLTSINLSACKQLTDNGIVSLAKHQKELQYLKLTCLDITDTSVIAVGKYLSELKFLDLNSCRQITVAALPHLEQLTKGLVSLNLYSCYQLTNKRLEKFFLSSKDNTSNTSPPLTSLTLNGCSLTTDSVIIACSKVFGNLQELDISSSLHVTNVGIQAIASSLMDLRVLKLSWCDNVTDHGLLGTGCQGNNKCVDGNLNGTVGQEKALEQGVSSSGLGLLTKLCSLDISHCTRITDNGLTSIYQLKNLRTLNINMCIEITDVSLQGIAKHMCSLECLSLNGCNLVTDVGMVAVAQNLPHLSSLDISKCDLITDLSILTLAKRSKNLTHLDLSMCAQVTSHSIDELEANLPRLVSLQLRYSEFQHKSQNDKQY
ncbi:F-box/LRR-repeat protein 14-like isoform X2 [Actinia tenebrosa]|uniref:F-box/LRR-repeat protein 14-like isoform X2 n=1 Tax=Actinia tenebrosa TaxID=6105 RepID=A0A6P8I8F6_ACTTE|nr:F-box/LRR-repeat protein 14-like isoform X2 [Actinia tenebrosa]